MQGRTRERLAVFLPSMREGGAERSTARLTRGMAQQGHAVDLVLAQAEGPHLAEVDAAVRVVDLGAPRMALALPALVRYLRRERPRALLAIMNYASITALWARALARVPTRVVVSERNTLSNAASAARSLRDRAMPWLIRRFYPWADVVLGNSRGVAEDLVLHGLAREKVGYIYNPIVTPELASRADAPVEHPWLAPGLPPVVLGVGRLRPQKDFATLIRALALVRRKRPARLLILGEGDERGALEALARELGVAEDVSLPGFLPNPHAFMRRVAVFVLSSAWEGLPNVLIEAMACGARVVSTDCPSGPREILAGGRHGALVPVGDAEAMAAAIERALAGGLAPPPPESWRPFLLETAVAQYLDVLLGAGRGTPLPRE